MAVEAHIPQIQQGETMKKRLLEAKARTEGVSLEDARARIIRLLVEADQ